MHATPQPPHPDAVTQEFSRRLLAMIDRAFLHEIQQAALQDMVRLTGSRVGFLYVLDAGPGTIRVHNVCVPGRTPAPAICESDEGLDQVGYWSACLLSGRPVIRNEATVFGAPLTLPLGEIRRDLTVPVRDGDKIVAVVGVGNRPDDYGPAEGARLDELSRVLWRVVVRKRLRDLTVDGAG